MAAVTQVLTVIDYQETNVHCVLLVNHNLFNAAACIQKFQILITIKSNRAKLLFVFGFTDKRKLIVCEKAIIRLI